MKSLQNISINPKNSILVIVDMENEFCKPGGKVYYDTNAQFMPGIISAIQGLAMRSRNAGIPIIYIQSVRTLKEPEFTVFGGEPKLELESWAVEIVKELSPRGGNTIVQKFSHDPFYKTKLDDILQKLVPDPTSYYAIVTGGAINVCAYHAVMGFHLRDYWTVVPVDSVYYRSEADMQIALNQLSFPAYPNVFLSRSDLIEVSHVPEIARPTLVPRS
ncbi:isochorismatase family cysteine hydrolase [Chloroflexota bacterium]